jgi:hypothetical protein
MYAGDDWSLAENDLTSRTCSNGRDRSSSLEFIVSGLSMQFDMYPDGDVSVSKLAISAQDLNLCDQNVHAPWKMVHIFFWLNFIDKLFLSPINAKLLSFFKRFLDAMTRRTTQENLAPLHSS